jgi:hypothetical protein
MTTSSGARPVKLRDRAGAPPDEVDSLERDDAVDWAAGSELHLELARAKANDNLAAALVAMGWSQEGARVVARACVKPDDVRRRLAAPVELRVPGGVLLIVETTVFSPGVTTYPANLRELGRRQYPLGMIDQRANHTAVSEPMADSGHTCELILDVGDPSQLAERVRSSETWLNRHNPLANDVAVEGVLQPITLVGMRIDHRNGALSVNLLTAADGSSRTTAAHKVLGIDAADLLYRTGSSDRLFRQQVGSILRLLQEHGWTGLTEDDRRRLRALTMPARIVVGYRQEIGRSVSFDAAIRSLIGLMHIAPPKPYGAEVERDATADAVLGALQRPHGRHPARISEDEARWYAAVMTPKERDAAGFSPHEDVRAADITRVFLHGGRRTTLRVNAGIRGITARNSPTAEERVAIAVELVLRPWRTTHAADDNLNLTARRSALQRAYGMPDIARQIDAPLLEGIAEAQCTLEELRDFALEEVASGLGRSKEKPLGDCQVELATKAAYYLIMADPMGLRREAPPSARLRDDGESVDQRSPSAVLAAMVATVRGVRQAYEVIVCGRSGRPLREITSDSRLSRNDNGKLIVLTDARLRATYGGKGDLEHLKTGLAAAERAWRELVDSSVALEKATKALGGIRGVSGRSYLDEDGWPAEDIDEVRNRLDGIDHSLRGWGARWIARQADMSDDGDE